MLFVTKTIHNKMIRAKEKEIKALMKKVEAQEETVKDLRGEIEYEHLENYNNHRKLLAIEKLLKEQDYDSVKNLKNRINTILKEKELDVSKTY